MFRSLCVSTLVAVQLLSWSGPSLYLCLANDGSVCVDFGPAGCRCCEHHCDTAACGTSCEDHLCPVLCDHRDRQELVLSDDCGCAHIQIVQQQNPVVVQKSVQPPTAFSHVTGSAIAAMQLHFSVVASALVTHRTWLENFDIGAEAHLSSVVLRC